MDKRSDSSVLVASALIGALVGLGAGVLLLRRAQERGTGSAITRNEGVEPRLAGAGLAAPNRPTGRRG